MKKLFYTIGLAMLVASCSQESDTGWTMPYSADQEDAKSISLSITPAAAVDYANIDDVENAKVQLFVPQVTSSDDGPVTYMVTVWNADKTKSVELEADENGYVSAQELKDAVIELYGKKPEARTLNLEIAGYQTVNKTSLKVAGISTLSVKLVAPFIDEGYWLVGDFCGWNKDAALQFKHIGDGDVYDNPEFEITFTINATDSKQNDFYWKVIPQNNYDGDFWKEGDNGVVGVAVNGDTSMDGLLTTNSPQAGMIVDPGIYKIVINMMDYTYKIEKYEFTEFIYVPGNGQKYFTTDGMPDWGWTPELASALRSPKYDGVYSGFTYLDGDFKFTKERNWNSEYNYGSFNTYDPIFTQGEGSNITCTEPGYYKVVADVASGKLSATKLTWGLVGPATPAVWDASSYVEMEYNMSQDCWEIVTYLNADEFKFTTNGTWDINLGGDANDLSEGAGNLRINEAGTYRIKLYPSRALTDKMYCTIEKVEER